jgi:hypothetical protein
MVPFAAELVCDESQASSFGGNRTFTPEIDATPGRSLVLRRSSRLPAMPNRPVIKGEAVGRRLTRSCIC